jgi:hypothetical protein
MAVSHDGKICWVLGSKNVHGVLRHSHYLEDLNNPVYTETRYSYFLEMATTFHEVALKGSFVNIHDMIEYLSSTHHTMVGEWVSPKHQHIVDYGVCPPLGSLL